MFCKLQHASVLAALAVGAHAQIPLVVPGLGGNDGLAVANIGADLNGNGFNDLAIGAPNSAVVRLWDQPSIGASAPWGTLVGPTGSFFGLAIYTQIDFTGDGVRDIVVGAPGALINQVPPTAPPGQVTLFNGATLARVWTAPGQAGGDLFGWALSGIPDVDGDGVGEVVVGFPGFSANTGGFVVLSGSSGAFVSGSLGPVPGAMAGYALASNLRSDLDGNGIVDIVVGLPGGGAPNVVPAVAPGFGMIAVVTSTTLAPVTVVADPGLTINGMFGCSVDFAIGATARRVYVGAFGVGGGNGAVFSINPATASVVGTAAGAAGSLAGFSVRAAASDLDGDGLRDILVGLPGADLVARLGTNALALPLQAVFTGPAGSSFGLAVDQGTGLTVGSTVLIGAPTLGGGASQIN